VCWADTVGAAGTGACVALATSRVGDAAVAAARRACQLSLICNSNAFSTGPTVTSSGVGEPDTCAPPTSACNVYAPALPGFASPCNRPGTSLSGVNLVARFTPLPPTGHKSTCTSLRSVSTALPNASLKRSEKMNGAPDAALSSALALASSLQCVALAAAGATATDTVRENATAPSRSDTECSTARVGLKENSYTPVATERSDAIGAFASELPTRTSPANGADSSAATASLCSLNTDTRTTAISPA
jgi:hypothetical protein